MIKRWEPYARHILDAMGKIQMDSLTETRRHGDRKGMNSEDLHKTFFSFLLRAPRVSVRDNLPGIAHQ